MLYIYAKTQNMAVLQLVELKEIGTALRKIRKKAKGLDQVEVQRAAKISSTKLSDLENNRGPVRLKDVQDVADAIGIKVMLLIAEDENDIKRLLEP
jgi:cytoskeletal protein RodZ